MSEFRRKLMMAYAANLGRDNITYPGLIAAWSAKGKTNDDEDRAILKDLTGNGHDITLNGFAFSGMSGYGGYNWDFNTFSRNNWEHTDSKIVLDYNNKPSQNPTVFEHAYKPSNKIKGTKIKVSGIKNGSFFNLYNQLNTIDGDGASVNKVLIKSDGIYSIPDIIISDESIVKTSYYGFNGIHVRERDIITIELIPEYPDALVFDGVDDYGINKDMPILTDYTIIAKRKHNSSKKKTETFISKTISGITGEFVLELATPTVTMAYSFGEYTTIKYQNNITYQTKVSYNGKVINVGMTDGGKVFNIGKRNTETDFYTGAFYSAYLFDRSLDEQEIKAFIRKYIDPEYLLPSEIPTPDCYYDFTNGDNTSETRETITDLSGNGNDSVAHNFAWNEEGSGYKDGALYFDGIDDYVSLDAFDSGFKTVFMVCYIFKNSPAVVMYDQRYKFNNNFAIFSSVSSKAYTGYNQNNTFINNKENTKLLCTDLLNKKHLIHILSKEVYDGIKLRIGSSTGNNQFSNMALYKFLGFKEVLTEEQINAVIKKYNLLDGVDEIEVS